MTRYVVMKKVRGNGVSEDVTLPDRWELVDPPVDAVSAEAAIRKALDGDASGTYVAVPIRSFAPVKVSVETKRTVKIG